MEHISSDLRLARFIERSGEDSDRHLPAWARRSNPIIRRELGSYWRTILPETTFLKKAFLAQAIYIFLSLPFPFLIDFALPAITAAILLFPVALVMYAQILVLLAVSASRAVSTEYENGTLTLLRATPYPMSEIIGSKVASALWRQVEDLSLLLTAAALMSLPLLISQVASRWPLTSEPLLSRGAMILGLAVSILRLVLEPLMVCMVGALMGAALRGRSQAMLSTLAVMAFYFLLLNLAQHLPLSTPLQLVADVVLPLALPLLITWGAFTATRRLLLRE